MNYPDYQITDVVVEGEDEDNDVGAVAGQLVGKVDGSDVGEDMGPVVGEDEGSLVGEVEGEGGRRWFMVQQ